MNASRAGGKPPEYAGPSKANNNRTRSNRPQRRNRNKYNRKANPRRPRGPPQSPQIKVMFRNIGNAEVYGTVEGIAGMIRSMVTKANERLTGPAAKKILLEDETLTRLIESDKLANEALAQWKKRSEATKKDPEEKDECSSENKATVSNEGAILSGMKELDINNKTDKILARVMYVVPPKKTRRRGEKPGNAYLVLTTSAIEAMDTTIPNVNEAPAKETADAGQVTAEAGVKTVEAAPRIVKVDYSRQIAERQLALAVAFETMTAIALEDSKGEQAWAGCVVEEARNGKTWRPPLRKDTREGTVENSPGFKAFMDMTQKEREELQSRAKPAPGGGHATLSTGFPSSESGKPVAALVLHLRNKREKEKALKKNKRKNKDAKKKGTANSDTQPNDKDASGAGAKRRKRKGRGKPKILAGRKPDAKS